MTVPDRLRLPIEFPVMAIAAEAVALPAGAWVPHFNTSNYEGDWSVAPLRSVGGRSDHIYPDPTATAAFADTELFERCPRTRAAVAGVRCPTTAVRFLRLGAGATISEHRDLRLAFADGEVRLHVPVVTSPEVEFVLDGGRVPMQAGECWYLDLTQPHRVTNRDMSARIHLAIDCVVDDWLSSLIVTCSRADRR
jgi:hypothetical protein